MAQYCTESQLYEHGVPRGGIPNPARLCYPSASTDIITLDGHGFATDAELLFRVESGGTMPSPLSAGTTYYAIPLTSDTFKVSTSAGGSVVNLTTAGTSVLVSTPLPIDAAITWASDLIDNMLVGNSTPLTAPYPAIIQVACAELAAIRLMQLTGGATIPLTEKLAQTQKLIDRFAKGIPIVKSASQKSGNLAVIRSGSTDRWGDDVI
jgi:phage gp36-like protein